MTRLLLLDHEDSFTANLRASLVCCGVDVEVLRVPRLSSGCSMSAEHAAQNFQGIVFSPGPGHPEEYPASAAFFAALPPTLPVLGVCLGLQIVFLSQGFDVAPIGRIPVHGRREPVDFHVGSHACQGEVVLFNSLGVIAAQKNIAQEYQVVVGADGRLLVASHRVRPLLLCQFHPESFASTAGVPLVRAFVGQCDSPNPLGLC